jgi:Tol biopolymer transport system component
MIRAGLKGRDDESARPPRATLAGALGCLSLLLCVPPLAVAQTPELISVRAGTTDDPAGWSRDAAISGDGRYVTFLSKTSSLVTGPQSLTEDVYLRDRVAGTTERISVGRDGALPNGNSGAHDVSHDGRFVVFESTASNLVLNDTNGRKDVFLRDRLNRTTRRLSTTADGSQIIGGPSELPSITPDGRFVCFITHSYAVLPTRTYRNLVVRDLWTDRFELASVWNDGTNLVPSLDRCSMNADGRLVAFPSAILSLEPFDPNGGARGAFRQIFVRDLAAGRTEVVSVNSRGVLARNENDAPVLSGDGRYVYFVTYATNLLPNDAIQSLKVVGHDRLRKTIELVSIGEDGLPLSQGSFEPATTSDGRFVAFSAFLRTSLRVFVRDRIAARTELLTKATGDYGAGRRALSADGRYVAFEHLWSRNIYVLDRGGDAPPIYEMYLRPRAIDYGPVQVGSALKKGFTLSNAGSAPLPVTTVELRGQDRAQFRLRSYCGQVVPVGERCWISVEFAPTTAGDKRASLHVVAGGIERYRALRGGGVR